MSIETETSDDSALNDGAPCLHCVLTGVLNAYWAQFGAVTENGAVGVDIPLTVAKITEVMANVIMRIDRPADQEKLIADAHAVLDGVIHTIQTGEPFEYNLGGPGAVH